MVLAVPALRFSVFALRETGNLRLIRDAALILGCVLADRARSP